MITSQSALPSVYCPVCGFRLEEMADMSWLHPRNECICGRSARLMMCFSEWQFVDMIVKAVREEEREKKNLTSVK